VIDFSVLKEKMGKWIDDNWDHTFLIYEKDKELLFVKNYLQSNKQVFICNFNPTAENMANFLLHDVCPKLFDGDGIKISKVVLYETENCFVEVSCEV
jgi:6-pyruvoyltetrahydropterin/6-carboxytetrahydropterin synthase